MVNEQGSIAAEAVHNSNRFEGYVPGETGADENQPCISGHICEEGLICVEGMCIDEDDYTIEFEDVRLERKIKGRLCETDELYCNSPEGEKIRYVDCQSMTYLDASESEIASLVGIEQCNALTVINLYKNNISDITPLASLANLNYLYLHGNSIEDITTLVSLTELCDLFLSHNNIKNIEALYNNSGLGGPNDRVILGNNPLIGEYYFHNTSF